MSYNTILALLFLAAIVFAIVRILLGPLKILFKLVYSCIVSAIGIFLFNFIGGIVGIHVGLNLITVLIVGLLGLPGLALILILQIFFWYIYWVIM